MRRGKGLYKLVVVAVTAATLMLMAAVGAAAASGTFGSVKAFSVVSLLNNGKHTGKCHPPKKTHKHGTPGHKHHPCGADQDRDDSD